MQAKISIKCLKYDCVIVMSTSVKINLESKKKLEELQAMLTLKLGRKIPQHEILDALIKLGSSKVDELVKHFSGVELPLSPEK